MDHLCIFVYVKYLFAFILFSFLDSSYNAAQLDIVPQTKTLLPIICLVFF